jgi:hypothetical protein
MYEPMRQPRHSRIAIALRLLCMSIVVLAALACASAQPDARLLSRVLLPNLHPMAVNELGQNYTVNGYLAFQMECLGESKDYDYWFFAGVGGDAHTQVYTSDPAKWCNCLSHLDFTPELVKTWYDAVGYDFTILTEEQFNADRPRYVGELMKCIDRGIPVIAKQVTKDNGDFWLLVGYEEKGGQLLFLNDNYKGAEKNFHEVPTNKQVNYLFILPGVKKKAPPLADVYRKVVLNIPALLTQPKKGDISYGRGAFDAWADHLLAEDYVGKTDEQIDGWKHHGIFVCIVATNGSCRTFLERAQKLCPDLPFLAEVNKEYTEMGRLWWKDLNAAGGSFNMTPATFRNTKAKQPIADILRRMGGCCDRIVEIYRKNGYGPEAKVQPTPQPR